MPVEITIILSGTFFFIGCMLYLAIKAFEDDDQ